MECVLRQVKCYNNKDSGIVCVQSSSIEIIKSSCNRNTQFGIYCDVKSSDIVVDESRCNENLQYDGICIEHESKVKITHSTCSKNNRNGILCGTKSTVAIINCHCNQNTSRGIAIEAESKGIIKNTFCNHNEESGIFCYDNSTISIQLCTCNHSVHQSGIQLKKGCKGTVLNCDCCHNYYCGVYCVGIMQVEIKGCKCLLNKRHEILYREKSRGSVTQPQRKQDDNRFFDSLKFLLSLFHVFWRHTDLINKWTQILKALLFILEYIQQRRALGKSIH